MALLMRALEDGGDEPSMIGILAETVPFNCFDLELVICLSVIPT